ncbi:MAG: hypothetical protein Q8L86_03065 [Vicinamibacterales bacterium]|nr:hypothetical protein [Vicinamibacterales bacterium]
MDYFETQKFVDDAGIASFQASLNAKDALDQANRALRNQLEEARMRSEAARYRTGVELAADAGFKTRAELQATADHLFALHAQMAESGEFTSAQITEAWQNAEAARRAAMGQTQRAGEDARQQLLSSTSSLLGQLGAKYKAAAIAGAIISTYQAVAKSMASLPWPANLISAAGALAAGGEQAVVHGDEAIIPRGGGHQLAGEIAAGLVGRLGGASGGGEQTIIVNLDGRQIAKSTVRHWSSVLEVQGVPT